MSKYYRKVKKQKLALAKDRRIILISDIHGNYTLFNKLLTKVKFNANDYLFLLGDIIEKGHDNLKTLRYVMDLTKQGNVFPLLGNCDDIYARDIVNIRSEQMFLNYALVKGNSVITEMASELKIEITKDSDVKALCKIFVNEYQEIIKFLDSLPHLIEFDEFYLVHAGINDLNDDNAYDFMHLTNVQNKTDKYVVAGHNPVINYQQTIPSFNPIIDYKEKLILIDGGNNVNPYGQLNALIIDNLNHKKISYDYVDEFPIIKLNQSYHGSLGTINLTHGNNVVTILERRDKYSICQHDDYIMPVFNSNLYVLNHQYHCSFASNHFFELSKGEEVSLLNESDEFLLVKKGGIVGLIG